jgi:hypothetical protein
MCPQVRRRNGLQYPALPHVEMAILYEDPLLYDLFMVYTIPSGKARVWVVHLNGPSA